ncbi:ABC transporter permease [Halosimplex marinum]|uniref:ABC transporter permease n=1 Tax=Halosimplex marinum TaxID=3396620 RepID=UPI003F5783BC
MSLRAFLAKEWYQIRRSLAVLLVLLVLLPGAAAMSTATFQHTIPEDIPVGVTPAADATTEDELLSVQAGAALYASPIRYASPDAARTALTREEVYLVLVVPHGLQDEGADVTVRLLSDQRITPFQEAANYTQSTLSWQLNNRLPADVTVDHERIGVKKTLSEYLVPSILMCIVVLFSFLYFPLELRRERDVFERVALKSRIEYAVAAKLAVHGALLVVPLSVFQLVSLSLGYRVEHFALSTVVLIALTFAYTAAVSGTVMFSTGLRQVGAFVNVGLLLGVLTFSSLFYPVGYFSGVRKSIATALPTYHSMILTRSTMLKDTPLSLFGHRVALLALFTAAVGLLFWSSMRRYQASETHGQ